MNLKNINFSALFVLLFLSLFSLVQKPYVFANQEFIKRIETMQENNGNTIIVYYKDNDIILKTETKNIEGHLITLRQYNQDGTVTTTYYNVKGKGHQFYSTSKH